MADGVAASTQGRLLVAGDDPVLVDVLEHVLGAHHRVIRASGGADVIALAGSEPIDLLVLDMHLPDMGGDKVLDWLEAHRPELAERVLFLSGSPDEVDVVFNGRVPPQRVMAKPFKVAEVRQAVDRLLTDMETS